MKVAIVLLAMTMLMPAQANAAVSGVGATSCSEFAIQMKSDPVSTQLNFLSWAQGFLSAVSMYRELNETDPLLIFSSLDGEIIADTIWSRVRYYCDEHPLHDFSSAVIDLME